MNVIKILKAGNRKKFSYFIPGIIAGIVLVLFFAGTIATVSASGIEASREISAGTVYAGETFTVTVHIRTDQYIEAPALDENLPEGWNVSRIEDDGAVFQNIETFKESTMEWIWVESIQAAGEKTVVYRVFVPSVIEPGNFTFSGNVSAYSIPSVPVTGASEIIVTYPPPEANFSASPLSGIAPLKVQFTNLCTDNADAWEWDFNGNESVDSSEKDPVWTYETAGTYTVVLKAVNNTYGTDTEIKTDFIIVTEEIPSSGGSSSKSSGSSGGGGGGGSPESSRNVELKEISNEQVFKGIHTSYTFKGGINDIVTIEFDPKKNFGKTTTIVEILKNTSVIVKEPAPGIVYKNLNIWVGNSGFSNPENFENAMISFRVNKAWLSENDIGESTIALYRYSEDKWAALPTTLTGDDENYFYFTAETPGFSPFAIVSPKKNSQSSIEIAPATDKENNITSTGKTSGEENDGNPASDEEKENKSAPGAGILFAAAGFLASYVSMVKKRMK
ncbi:MAG TPA: PGF-pre-PGF domain-containing protein [Methanosarcina sp.]|nr:PGF-pre-PGF domain-containing protein [Methanosarcina sp.]